MSNKKAGPMRASFVLLHVLNCTFLCNKEENECNVKIVLR
ncbi:MAG: hypothetical protein RIS68_169 [Bacteroidota bacterium]